MESATALSDETIARNDGFCRVPESDFRFETKVRKVMINFKFDALYRYAIHKHSQAQNVIFQVYTHNYGSS